MVRLSGVRRGGAVALCAGGLVFAGCGTSTSSITDAVKNANGASAGGSKGAGKSACEVFTPAIARAQLGRSAHLTRRAQPNPHETQCVYAARGKSAGVMVGDWSFIHTFSGAGAGREATPIRGLGDEAYATRTGLLARKGQRGLSITYISATGDFYGSAATRQENRDRTGAERLARRLLPKL